jgi:hypothetical protein
MEIQLPRPRVPRAESLVEQLSYNKSGTNALARPDPAAMLG